MRRNLNRVVAALLIGVALVAAAHAANAATRGGLLTNMDLDFGGDDITTAANNADIKVTRTTLDLNGIYRFSNGWYLGAGLLRHIGPKLDGDGYFRNIKFDDATGFNAEVGWKSVALRVTKLEYSADGFDDADAGSIGLRFTWRPGAAD